jgi:hypothetical protein
MADQVHDERVEELTNALRLSEQCLKAIARTLHEIGLEKSNAQAEEFALELAFIRHGAPWDVPRRQAH